jgi:hypothetical protein
VALIIKKTKTKQNKTNYFTSYIEIVAMKWNWPFYSQWVPLQGSYYKALTSGGWVRGWVGGLVGFVGFCYKKKRC